VVSGTEQKESASWDIIRSDGDKSAFWLKTALKVTSEIPLLVSALGVRSRKLSNALNGQSWDGLPKPYHLELLRASEGTLSRWSRLHLQSLTPTNPHWVRVVDYGTFSLWVIHKESMCSSSGDINRLMMKYLCYYFRDKAGLVCTVNSTSDYSLWTFEYMFLSAWLRYINKY
jgi:hypothetical protein